MKTISNLIITTLIILATFFVESCNKQQNVVPAPAKLNFTINKNNLSSSIGNIVDMDMNLHDSCYYWYKDGTMSVGTYTNSTAYIALKSYSLPAGETPSTVVAIGIANNNYCYFWYADGTYSVGNSGNASAHSAPASYTVPSGESTTTIVAMSIAKQGSSNVYTWYKDGTATVGSASNLASVRSNYTYTVASGRTVSDIVGIGIAGSNDHTFVWYNNGTTKSVSSGYTSQFDVYFGLTSASF